MQTRVGEETLKVKQAEASRDESAKHLKLLQQRLTISEKALVTANAAAAAAAEAAAVALANSIATPTPPTPAAKGRH
jgi:hypothetical protein